MTEHYMETEPSWNIAELYVFWLITHVISDIKQRPSSLYTINHHQYDNIYTSCKTAIIKWFTFTICWYHQLSLSLSLSPFLLSTHALGSSGGSHISRSTWRYHIFAALAARESFTHKHAHTSGVKCESLLHYHSVTFLRVCDREEYFLIFLNSFHSKCWQLYLRTGRHIQGRGKS